MDVNTVYSPTDRLCLGWYVNVFKRSRIIQGYMPESETEYIDYYPSGWTEEIHDKNYIEWVCNEDPAILVRLDGTMGEGDYTVTPITGVNEDGEEFVTKPTSRLSREEAFEFASALIYAMNGTIGRLRGDFEFISDK